MSKILRICVVSIILAVTPAISSFARATHSSSSGDDLGKLYVIGFVLVVWLLYTVINAIKTPKRVSQEKLNQLGAEAKEWFDKFYATKKLTEPDTRVVTGADEQALLDEPSKLFEARATRVYAGGGTRVEGIYIGGGESSSFQSLKELDSGALTLTTKRLVFTGSMESRVVNIKDIVSIDAFAADSIVVSTGRKAKRQVYTVRNPIIWATLIRSIATGAISPLAKSADLENESAKGQNGDQKVTASTDIRFHCPRCGQHLCIDQSGAGMAVNCPNCNEQIDIPRQHDAKKDG